MTLVMRCLAAGLLCVGLSAVQATAADWLVREASGVVRIQQPGAASVAVSATVLPLRPDRASIQQASLNDRDGATLFLGDTLTPGAILTTGGDGRIVLARGEQEIVIGPNARLSLPSDETDGFTRILQDAGTALFRVDRQDSQHFSVETPLLAAVVKGTTFTVSAAPDVQAVHVVEGLVEVTSLNGAQVELVPAGATALVDAADPATLRLEGSGAPVGGDASSSALLDGSSPARASTDDTASWLVPSQIGGGPLDIDAATDGLVQGGVAPPTAALMAAPSDGAPGYANHANPGSAGLPPTAAAIAAEVSRTTRVADGGNGNGVGSGGSNAGGNGNGVGSGGSNAGGNGNGVGSGGSNAGGNGNGVGSGGSNAGGNGNGVGSGGSNAGGNGNGVGSGGSNAGGNGNGAGGSN